MTSVKGILKYSIYIFIAGWMFVLGIMVGRGSSPVEFDTRKFQKRLETIAGEFGEKKSDGKIDLKFYDVLDRPVPEETGTAQTPSQEIMPKKETAAAAETMPLKTSRKKLTFKQSATDTPAAAKPTAKPTAKPAREKIKVPQGIYTIQVAAYKEFKDAVSEMARLEKKGFPSYRVKGVKDGQTWYRVRTGSFATYAHARKMLEKLKHAKINAMIIKRETNEDIKG